MSMVSCITHTNTPIEVSTASGLRTVSKKAAAHHEDAQQAPSSIAITILLTTHLLGSLRHPHSP